MRPRSPYSPPDPDAHFDRDSQASSDYPIENLGDIHHNVADNRRTSFGRHLGVTGMSFGWTQVVGKDMITTPF